HPGPAQRWRSGGPFRGAPVRSVLDEGFEVAPAQRMTQLAEGLGLDLPNPLARDGEALAHLFQRVLAFLADPKPQSQDFLFLRRQRRERTLHLGGQVLAQQRIVRRTRRLVLEEVAKLAVFAD